MGYLVLARKYRPQRFEDVVKQEHITKALANAVTSGRLAHAILLAGPRGTGKTTIARILAKCVNCETGPTAVPCNVCQSCKEITASHAADVFEIDGASNNKVDNVRELRENANYMPAHSPYKIYIIDEVHMLSDSAFNALLKILEEPPAHVKFFFATTDPNKIPITILSRCQRHDCRRVDLNSLINHMAQLCEKENIDISNEALTIIAREADGSIRDALSLLDLIITSTPDKIGTELIVDILGGLDRQSLFDMSQAVFDRDAGKIIEIIGRLYDRGQNMVKLFAELLAHFRNLLVVKLGGTTGALSDVSAFELNSMQAQIKEIPGIYLHQILDILFKEENLIRQSSSPKLAVEMAFIRVIAIRPALPIETLIEKIDVLQKGLAEKLPPNIEPNIDPNSKPGIEPDMGSNFESKIKPNPVSAAVAPEPALNPPSAAPPAQDQPDAQAVAPTSPDYQPAVAKDQPALSGVSENKPAKIYPAPPSVTDQDTRKPDQDTRKPDRPFAKKDEPLEKSWKTILNIIADKNPALAACFNNSQLEKISDHQLEIRFKTNKFNINFANREDHRSLIQNTCSLYFSNDIQMTFAGEIAASKNGMAQKRKTKKLETETLNHPLVEDAMKIFNGKIVEIKILQEV